jgi:hypothetical protein
MFNEQNIWNDGFCSSDRALRVSVAEPEPKEPYYFDGEGAGVGTVKGYGSSSRLDFPQGSIFKKLY